MVEFVEIQAVSYIVAALSFAVTCTYYIINLRNTEKIRRRDQVFQRLQLNMVQWFDNQFDVMYNYADFKSVEEFRSKYSRFVNPEAQTRIFYVINHFNSLGILLKERLIDADLLFQLYNPVTVVSIYEKYEPVIRTQGISPNGVIYDPMSYYGYKYLYAEAKKRYPTLKWASATNQKDFVERGRMYDEFFKVNPQLKTTQ